jgi:hypothetical protein
MQETGANRGYVISTEGFQQGAIDAAAFTNIELVTFAQFHEIYFEKWFKARLWAIERDIGDFNTYYEPLGKPGYRELKDDSERAAYDEVWDKYIFAGFMLIKFSPYSRMIGDDRVPPLPFDIAKLQERAAWVPDDIKEARGYRECLSLLQGYAKEGLKELRAVNPITRGKAPGTVTRDD